MQVNAGQVWVAQAWVAVGKDRQAWHSMAAARRGLPANRNGLGLSRRGRPGTG